MSEITGQPAEAILPTPEDFFFDEANWQRHRTEVTDWLQIVGDERATDEETEKLLELTERYGFEPVNQEDLLEKMWGRDQREVSRILQESHAGMVALSPRLTTEQKLDLLKMSAQAMYDSKHPLDGRRVIVRLIDGWWSSFFRESVKDPGIPVENLKFLYELGVACRRELPRLSRVKMMKAIATAEAGQPVKGLLTALAVLETKASQPSPEHLKKRAARSEERRLRLEEYERVRAERKLQKARRKFRKAVRNLADTVNPND